MPNLRVSSVHDSMVVEISLACTVFTISSMCDRSGAGDSQDFCVSAKARRRGRSLQTQKEREDDERRFALRTVTNGSAGPSSRVPNVSRAVTIGWMSAHITRPISNSFAGFFMLSGLTSQTIRVAQNRSSETITHVIYYRPSYENNIFRMNTVVYMRARVCSFVWDIGQLSEKKVTIRARLDSTLRNDRTVFQTSRFISLKAYKRSFNRPRKK